jgi:tRNA-splicing ligase RtcB
MSESVPVRSWLASPLPADVKSALERLAEHPDVARIAVMPDVHLAEDVCVGTVVATRSQLLPAAVGGDIGCGMAAVRLSSVSAEVLEDRQRAAKVLAGFGRRIPAIRHARGSAPALPEALSKKELSAPSLQKAKDRDGCDEFGTLGRGNHFVELQSDEAGELWLMLHSGSRAMGQLIRDHHLARATEGHRGLKMLPAESETGVGYLRDMEWALDYAQANRRALLLAAAEVVSDALDATVDESSTINCHHNHVRSEEHFGERLWVHRKGAIPASEDEAGIIPGSMGAPSYHVTGRGEPEALRSSSHGAGRLFSRSEARKRISVRTLERELGGIWFDHRLSEQLRDEAPSAYKDIGAVMRAQRDLTRITRKLRPLLSYKGV